MPALVLILHWIIDLFQDRHADGHMTPQIDSHQDYELISLVENGGKTTMKFKRRFETCDPEDNAIQVKHSVKHGTVLKTSYQSQPKILETFREALSMRTQQLHVLVLKLVPNCLNAG